MLLKEKGSLQWLQFKNLQSHHNLVHGFTTRNGGASNPPFSSLNMGMYTKDDEANVEENYRRILTALEVEDRPRFMTQQVHSDRIFSVDANTEKADRTVVRETDGLVTNTADSVLITYYADCVPLFFYDPVQHAGGVVHSGWKGTSKQIGMRMVEKMQALYGSNPQDILAGIGPCAGMCCYEIGQDVIAAFEWLENLEDFLKPTREGHFKIDLKGINRHILMNAGIAEENLEVSELCTMCESELLYSYRRERPGNGLMAGIFALK